MKPMPLGDYYVWYCDRCDSRNLTLWTRMDTSEITCGACFAANAISSLEPTPSAA